jgi:LemA protein
MGFVIFLAVLAVVAVYGIGIYNGLVKLREAVKQAWSNIDVLLVQRHDELPKLVETCKQYMQYEQETLERVMKARASVFQAAGRGDVAAVGAAESALRAGLGQLFAVVENYPQLKADESFRHLQARITQLEESIADRRELYNASVNLNNVRIAQFPDLIVASLFGFKAADLLEFTDEQTRDVDMKALFS